MSEGNPETGGNRPDPEDAASDAAADQGAVDSGADAAAETSVPGQPDSGAAADGEDAPVAGAGEADTGPLDPDRLPTTELDPQLTTPAAKAYSAGQPQAGPNGPRTRSMLHEQSDPARPATQALPPLDGFTPLDGSGAPVGGPPSSPIVVKAAPSRRKRWRTVGLVSAALVLLLVIAGVSTELYFRSKVTGCLQDSFQSLTGTSTDVSMPRRPMLISWIDGEVPWVQVDTQGDGGKEGAMSLHARADGVSSDGTRIRSLEGNVFVPYQRVRELASENPQSQAQIDAITGSGESGTITIESTYQIAIIGVPAEVRVKPTTENGRVKFVVEEASAWVFGLPNDFAQDLVDQVTDSMLGPLFDEITVHHLKVTDEGIEFSFLGDDVDLRAASMTGTGGTCA